jgi:hypothetical protein
MNRADRHDQAVIEAWVANETLVHVREFVRRTLGK